MGLNSTPSANRTHIAFFGLRNAGKSTLLNAITNQDIAVVSDIAGTTTDPVYKSMELLPLGPVTLIDTPGIDDTGELGEKRVLKTKKILSKTDIAVLVTGAGCELSDKEKELTELFRQKQIPYIIVRNKCDKINTQPQLSENEIYTSATCKTNIDALKEKLANLIKPASKETGIFDGIIKKDDIILLVTPIDESAPKGRLILPQVQSIRDILDKNAICMVTKETEFKTALSVLNRKPALVVCDSQVFRQIDAETPDDIELTSFSILMARVKGFLQCAVKSAAKLDTLTDSDIVLISEGCTHHRQCGDIGSVKLPALIRKHTGANPGIELSSGSDFPDDLSRFSLVIHCGACMLGDREVKSRMIQASDQGIPFTNYGTAIAHMNGILKRSTHIFTL